MHRNCDEDSGRSSCSAVSLGISPILDDKRADVVKRRNHSKPYQSNDLKVSVRPRSCIALLKSPDERDPFPSNRIPRSRNSIFNIFGNERKGGLSDAHSTLDVVSSTLIDNRNIKYSEFLNTAASNGKDRQNNQQYNFRRGKPVQRAASRLYRADNVAKGPKSVCVGPEFIVRASQAAKHLDLTLSALAEKKVVTVILLNGQRIEVLCDTNVITAGQLFEAIVHSEKFDHSFMLGVAVLVGGDFIFLPEDFKLKKIAPECWNSKHNKKRNNEEETSFTVFLRIKFFLPTNIARNIQGGEWRHRVYLQLRRSIVEGQLTSTLQNLILLSGYALHIEFGEFTYREHGCADYFLFEHYLPENLILDDMSDLKLRMKRAHESRRGMDRGKAVINFITLAQTFRDYGAHFYSAVWATRDGFCRDVWLSIGPRGVTLYSRNNHVDEASNPSNRIVLQSLPWHHIHTFCFNKKSLYILPNTNSGLSKIGVKYKLKMTDGKSYFAFWLASLHHRLYLKLYAKEDFINYLADELNCSGITEGSPKKIECSNYQDSYNLAVRNPIRIRKPIKKKFRVDIFGDKKVQNKENHKPNTEELLKKILIPEPSDLVVISPTNTCGNSSNDGLSSSESCSLPRRHGVKMGTRVFGGQKSVYPKSPVLNKTNLSIKRFDDVATPSDSDDLCSNAESKQHCIVNSMQLLPERLYNQKTTEGTAFVLESPKVYPDALNYIQTSNESCTNASIFERLDTMECVQGERLFVTASLERDHNNALGLQVAEGSDGNVYIKSITSGGAADLTKKLSPGDQIISVNGQTLLNVKYDKALMMLQNAPKKVELIVLQNLKPSDTHNDTKRSFCSNSNTLNGRSLRHSIASGLEDLEITDDELLNEEALKTIYALIKLTKEKVISRMKDKENRRSSSQLQKCYSENVIYDDTTDTGNFSSQENTPQKGQKFHTWRGFPNHSRVKRRPLSLSIPAGVNLSEAYIDEETGSIMKKTSLKSIQSSLNSLDRKSVTSSSSKNVALPRNFGLSRKWVGPVRYPVTPCKSNESAINERVVKKHFIYGAPETGTQFFL